MSDALRKAASRAKAWLFDEALPVWHGKGIDRQRGGFSELLDLAGEPLNAPRRVTVQARQAYVFAEAGHLGWQIGAFGWQDAVRHGLQALPAYRRSDGLYRFKMTLDGAIADDTPNLYGQAFVLFALAHASRALDAKADLQPEALRLLATLRATLGHPRAGFEEAQPRTLPLKSNPHMHMFEASLAWIEAGGDPVWQALADELADLCATRFIDPATGWLREYFDADWQAITDDGGQIAEPGHQYEWAWLLVRYATLCPDKPLAPHCAALAQRLFALGESGLDAARGVPHMEVVVGGAAKIAQTRLWPSTERLKAALAMGDDAAAVASVDSLFRFFDTPVAGLWGDRMNIDGSIESEPAPASTFYHIICAFAELIRAAEKA
jgi:mannose/cellobiose epimerase-like protein (N-acyl-D-glucosamine 2-epimerase family)